MTSDRFVQSFHAEVCRQRVGQAPRHHPAAGPVHHGEQEYKTPSHRDVGDVGGPDMVGTIDHEASQEIRINWMIWMPPAAVGLPIQRMDGHQPHQPCYALATGMMPFTTEQLHQPPGTEERVFQVQLVHAAHEFQIFL